MGLSFLRRPAPRNAGTLACVIAFMAFIAFIVLVLRVAFSAVALMVFIAFIAFVAIANNGQWWAKGEDH